MKALNYSSLMCYRKLLTFRHITSTLMTKASLNSRTKNSLTWNQVAHNENHKNLPLDYAASHLNPLIIFTVFS